MSIIQQDSPLAVDRSEETMSIQQSGYASTIQVTRDAAAERRNRVFQVMWIAWAILGVVEILLGVRFFLKMISANPDSAFGSLIYDMSGVFIAPFAGMVATLISNGTTLEITTLIAMTIYALFFLVLVTVFEIVAQRSSSSTTLRTVSEQMPDGSNRTVRSTRIG